MNNTVPFPIYTYREVGLFQEILHDLLRKRSASFYQIANVCEEVEELLTGILGEQGPYLVELEDTVCIKELGDFVLENNNYERIEVASLANGVEVKIPDLELGEAELKEFSSRQSSRQKSGYVNLLNQSLKRKNEQIKKMFESKNYLLNFLAHELRNPLTAILNSIELIRSAPEEIEQLKLDKLLENVSMDMKKLVDEVLEFSKIETGKLSLEVAEIELKEFCEDFASYGKTLTEAKSLSWRAQGLEELSAIKVKADPFRTRQVLTNLVGNALKFTSEGGVSFCASVEQERAVLEVRDTGRGINEKFGSAIFKEFTQESATISKEFGGSGLGLNICYNLTKKMGGDLWFQSEVGKGTSFFIGLPLVQRSE